MLADAINMVIAELIYVIIQDMSWPLNLPLAHPKFELKTKLHVGILWTAQCRQNY